MKKMNETNGNVGKQIILYVVGLWFLALGVSLSIKADLGVSPVNSIPYILSQIFSIRMGTCIFIVFGFYMLLQILILRKEYEWKNLLQIIFSTIFGYFVDITNVITKEIAVESYVSQLLLLIISILLIAFGITLYIEANLVPMPMEGLVIAISKKSKKLKFPQIKTICDSVVVLFGLIFSLFGTGQVIGIREGTVLTAISVGKLVGVFQRIIKPRVAKKL